MDEQTTACDALAWLLGNLAEGQLVQWPPGEPEQYEHALIEEALTSLRRTYPSADESTT